ncbi:hypothetical protein SAMN05216567_12665 [Variovorax sp. OK605]|uniref:hypothetical protein n=1 Tax=Variovorax sp. OK605 TaxID=1855317 RepID=UPI0008EFBA0C|nr:hypothetical protein [Variovorax sp. OK605]SFQ68760.1 hypothetical protein SAMN05216567_12665 [Variovorax sp. OK605]
MGLQDRDWYRDEMRRRKREEDAEEEAAARFAWLKTQRTRRPRGQGPKLWGADWHWSLQLLVWLAIAVLAIAGMKLLKL